MNQPSLKNATVNHPKNRMTLQKEIAVAHPTSAQR
jgi:hypothetical protein